MKIKRNLCQQQTVVFCLHTENACNLEERSDLVKTEISIYIGVAKVWLL